ncbi:DUF736 domain-containing protein [Sphingomonas sp. PB4P5]|uniref:DUF736 domain-containing protein n=1 Tax=Parasphingomonas puruogangriensis TaxID=3096155 RepID=UPI002FCAC44C
MIKIGEFTPRDDGYFGRLVTLGIDVALTIAPATHKDANNAPDYRVYADEDANGPEVGAGWKRSSERAGEYVAVVIDDPQFSRAIRANLFSPTSEGQPHLLLWQRDQTRRDSEQQ